MPARRRTETKTTSSATPTSPPSVNSDDQEPTDEDYRKKRDRNNQAVKKSRQKSNKKAKETKQRVDILKTDNSRLETKIDELRDNVKYLKNILLRKDVPPEDHKRAIAEILAEPDGDD